MWRGQGQRLRLPFRRYQIQPVWRAERPQSSRYREFDQCDVDIIGSNSPLCELDMQLLIHEAFTELNLKDYVLRINHRGLLSAVAQHIGKAEEEQALCTALDKLDKVGEKGVMAELKQRGFSDDALIYIKNFVEISQAVQSGNSWEATERLGGRQLAEPLRVLRENEQLLRAMSPAAADRLRFDPCLARGLSYYTGLIFEVTHPGGAGSLLGGGRYDNLTQRFSKEALPGVGLSFGLDRIHDLLLARDGQCKEATGRVQLLIAHLGGDEAPLGSLQLLQQLRSAGLRCEHYPDPDKLKKQFTYAEKKNIRHILFAGETECKEQRYGLRDIQHGQQTTHTVEEILNHLKK